MDHAYDAARSEIARFLADRAPFDSLTPEELGEVVAETEIEFHPAGQAILTEDGGPVTFLRVIHSGAVDIVHAGKLLDLLVPGDTFGHAAMMSGLPPGFEARAAEDTLCYRLPVAAARPLLERARTRELEMSLQASSNEPVTRLIRAPTVVCRPEQSVSEVARRMTDCGASSAVVDLGARGFGILTDRDIRTKIVAGGMPLSAPVSAAMTTPVFTVTPDRLGRDVLFELLERGIRHGVVVADGQLLGVVEDADLFAAHPRSWFGVRRQIARAGSVEALVEVAGQLSQIVFDLHSSNLRATEVARVLAALMDALVTRVLELSTPEGELPADGIVWVALGSQARREMTPASVPRGALVCSEPPPERWLRAVAETLERCGLPGEVVAHAPAEWAGADYDDELVLTVLIERRPLWGTPREPLPVLGGPQRQPVLDALARRALSERPPTGFDEDAVLEFDGRRSPHLDIRRAAVIPIVEIGRWAGAAAGLTEGSTPERLQAAAADGVLSRPDAEALMEAFDLALELRVAHHMDQLAAGARPDDRIEPRAISPLTRDHLRDVFRAVATVQRGLAA